MKNSLLRRGLALLALAALASTAQAVSQSVIIQGNNGTTGFNTSGSVNVPSTCTVTCHVEITLLAGLPQGQGGGGGCGVGVGNTFVTSASAGGGAPGTYTNTSIAYNQPAGTYTYGAGCGGPANCVDAYIDITFSW